jgi:signal transduction histidine kinase
MILQLSWWVTFQLWSNAHYFAEKKAALQHQVTWAQAIIDLYTEGKPLSEEWIQERIAKISPDLIWEKVFVKKNSGYQIYIKPEILVDIAKDNQAHIRMFIAEGLFFFLMLSIGVVLMLMTFQFEKRLNKQQNNFLAAVTHEFKTPLTAIRLFVDTLNIRVHNEQNRQRYLNLILKELSRLEHLVNKILTTNRLGGMSFLENPERINVVAFLEQYLKDKKNYFHEKNTKIVFSDLKNTPYITANHEALITIFENILDNAIKYNKQHPIIHINIEKKRSTIEIHIRDNGIGIAEKDIGKIAQKFYRVGDEMVRSAQGSGLGLHLVTEWMRIHHGKLVISSQGLNSGSCFTLVFPCKFYTHWLWQKFWL